jgi:transcriptional regulator with XRE-family HTH domain
VASGRGSPTLRKRQLGMELRRLRETAGITIDQVAERLECSGSKISRIETGQTGVTPRDVRDMLGVYNVDSEYAEVLLQIAREARQKGWWQLFGDVLTGAYVGLEAAADHIHSYEGQVVPGLLQTEEYAQAMILVARPDISATEVEKRVRVRMSRQSLLTQDEPLDLWVVLDEAVLRRPVGGPDVMKRQLSHLATAGERPNVTLQVLPFAAGAHAGMDGAFTMLLYDESADQNLVFASNAAGGLFLEKEDELERYEFIFDYLRAKALRPDESLSMILKSAKER